MTVIDLAPAKTRAAARPTLVERIAVNFGKIYRAWVNRRAFYRLGDLSDAELRDIGLTRADLHVAWGTSLGADPTKRLQIIAEQRNAG